MQVRGGEKDGEDVEVADHSSRSVVIEVNAQASREVCDRELEMSNREKMWAKAELWRKVNSVATFSSVDGCIDRRSRLSAILTLVANSKLSTVPILAFATLVLDVDKDGSDAGGDYSACSNEAEKDTIDAPVLVARQQLRADSHCRVAVEARSGFHYYYRLNFG